MHLGIHSRLSTIKELSSVPHPPSVDPSTPLFFFQSRTCLHYHLTIAAISSYLQWKLSPIKGRFEKERERTPLFCCDNGPRQYPVLQCMYKNWRFVCLAGRFRFLPRLLQIQSKWWLVLWTPSLNPRFQFPIFFSIRIFSSILEFSSIPALCNLPSLSINHFCTAGSEMKKRKERKRAVRERMRRGRYDHSLHS